MTEPELAYWGDELKPFPVEDIDRAAREWIRGHELLPKLTNMIGLCEDYASDREWEKRRADRVAAEAAAGKGYDSTPYIPMTVEEQKQATAELREVWERFLEKKRLG